MTTIRVKSTQTVILVVCFFSTCVSTLAWANEDDVVIKAFGSIGFGQSDNRQSYFDLDNKGANGHAISKLGLNISGNLSEDVSLATEILREQNNLIANWYFLNYRPTDNLTLRLGKQKLATWHYAETRSIGKTYPWVMLPMEVYQLNPLSSFFGMSLEYNQPVGQDFELVVEVQAGSDENSEVNGTLISADSAIIGSVALNHDNFTIKAAYSDTKLEIELPINAFLSTDINELNATFMTLGMKIDKDNFVLQSEYASIDVDVSDDEADAFRSAYTQAAQAYNEAITNGITGDTLDSIGQALEIAAFQNQLASNFVEATGWYASIGYLYEKLMPYIIYSTISKADDSYNFGNQTSMGIGAVYHVNEKLTLKGQYLKLDVEDEDPGLYRQRDASFTGEGPDANLVLFSADFLL